MLWIPLIAGLAIAVSILQTRVRRDFPEWGTLVSLTFVVVILLALLPLLQDILHSLSRLLTNLETQQYLAPVLRTIAAAYITTIGAQASRDAGEETIASIVEFAGKMVILIIALPIISAILQSLERILH